jgi:hypothetical protein
MHERLHALVYPRHVLVRSSRASPWLASQRDLATGQRVEGDVVEPTGGLADRSGARWPGAATVRRYTFREDRVELRDAVKLSGVRVRCATGCARWRASRSRQRDGAALGARGARAARGGEWAGHQRTLPAGAALTRRMSRPVLDMGSPIPEGMVRVREAGCRSRRAPSAVETT